MSVYDIVIKTEDASGRRVPGVGPVTEVLAMDRQKKIVGNLSCTSDLKCFVEYDMEEFRDLIDDFESNWVENLVDDSAGKED